MTLADLHGLWEEACHQAPEQQEVPDDSPHGALPSAKFEIAVLCCYNSTIWKYPQFTWFYYHPPLLS